MKIKKVNKKLVVNKQLVARLDTMNEIKGGYIFYSNERSCPNMPACIVLPSAKCPTYNCN
jgi:hypothetical protein